MKKRNNVVGVWCATQRGITLIALVITVIVLLILAGVTINLTLGENGIFKTAEGAARNYKEAENKELGLLEGFTNVVNNITNPMPFGTIIKTENKINYVADGEGNMIPVPVGFTALTGTKTTGFVIKDTSLDSEGNPTTTNGNEFVWIPVEKYERIAWTREGWKYTQGTNGIDAATNSTKITRADLNKDTYYWTEKMPNDEQTSVEKYGGYYIGRYEAGIVGYTDKSTTKDGTTTWTGYTGGKLVVQSGKEVWNYITRDRAVTEAGKLYNKADNNVTSKLCSSYAWDVALKFMETQNSTYPTNSVGGNYNTASGGTGGLQNTGYDTVHPCNIYDMGGNAWEWTTESCSDASYPCTKRGGYYSDSAADDPASYRRSDSEAFANGYISFRVTLYM